MNKNVLREKMEMVLKKELRVVSLRTRSKMNLTQSKMGERYVMSTDSYSDIESGENMCGTLTTILLLYDQDDRDRVIDDIVEKLDKVREEEYILL